MAARKRKKRINAPAQEPVSEASSVHLDLQKAWQKMVAEYENAAAVAETKKHVIEAAILRHIAFRLGSLGEDIEGSKKEFAELSSWLPPTRQHLLRSPLERKAFALHSIRKQRFEEPMEKWLIRLATQSPGRPPEARMYAVRAWESRIVGHKWPEIEKRFFAHRQKVENPGVSIRREVQLLKSVLRRYGVSVPAH